MISIQEVKKSFQINGSKLIYQFLDGLNWKQLTYKDINSNIDYVLSYLIANKITNKRVLSLSMNCLDSFILESSLSSLGCDISFFDERLSQTLDIKRSFDIIIIDDIEKLSSNPMVKRLLDEENEIISIKHFKNITDYKQKVKSIKNIHKMGLLSKRRLDDNPEDYLKNIRKKNFVEFINHENCIEVNIEDFFAIIGEYENIFDSINEKEFSSSLYLKPDLFSKSINHLFLLSSNKFTNNNSLISFLNNANEIMPKNLVIDSESIDNLVKISKDSGVKLIDLLGSRVKRIITYNYANGNNIGIIKSNGIEIFNSPL